MQGHAGLCPSIVSDFVENFLHKLRADPHDMLFSLPGKQTLKTVFKRFSPNHNGSMFVFFRI